MGFSVSGMSASDPSSWRYLYLKKFDTTGDGNVNESDNPIFAGVDSPAAAETAILSNLSSLRPFIEKNFIYRQSKPEGYTEYTVSDNYDGDTYTLTVDLDNSGKDDRVRVGGVNTPELRLFGNPEQAGGAVATDKTRDLLADARNQVYIYPYKNDGSLNLDGYKRLITRTFLEIKDRGFMDLSAQLILEGAGMMYFVEVDDPEQYSDYILLQKLAQQNREGIWGLPEYRDPLSSDGLKDWRITSFHAQARATADDPELLDGEYLRLVNTSGEMLDLSLYFVRKTGGTALAPTDITFSSPFLVPPGRTVKVVTGRLQTQSDVSDELVYSLGRTTPFWPNTGACAVLAPIGSQGESSLSNTAIAWALHRVKGRKPVPCP